MTAYTPGDKLVLTHDSCAGQVCAFRAYWYDGQAVQVEHADGHRQIVSLAYVRPATANEAA